MATIKASSIKGAAGRIRKGRARIGEIRKWKAGEMKKLSDGEWEKVVDPKKKAAAEKPKDKPAKKPAKQETPEGKAYEEKVKVRTKGKTAKQEDHDRDGHPTIEELAEESKIGNRVIKDKKHAGDVYGDIDWVPPKKARNAEQGMNWLAPEKRIALYGRDGYKCCYCGKGVAALRKIGFALSADHVTPNELGGKNHESNLVTACGRCNSARGCRSMRQFAGWMKREHNIDFETFTKNVRNAQRRVLNHVDEHGKKIEYDSFPGKRPSDKKRNASKAMISSMHAELERVKEEMGLVPSEKNRARNEKNKAARATAKMAREAAA